jgi:hypothetical protein
MFILRDLLRPLQAAFSDSHLGRARAHWFVFTLLAVIVPFTSSISSNLLRSLETLFGITPGRRRFYAFMASSKLPWERLWAILWSRISNPVVDGRLLVALDDSINNKSGRHIFGCGFFHDHTAKLNQPSYPWSQNIVSIGLLKIVKGRWACLPLAFRFYLMKKDIEAGGPTVSRKRKARPFASKLEQAVEMLSQFSAALPDHPVLVVTDSWFGNNGLFAPLRKRSQHFELLSRLRSNIALYDRPCPRGDGQRGRTRKYGNKRGSVTALGARFRSQARSVTLRLYGRDREVWFHDQVMMLKTLKCPVRVVWVYRRTRFIALFSTDLSLTPAQIIEYYGARWKIESGFKEIKQEIGSARAQVRTADSVTNHLQFCMMATTLTWLYAERIVPDPQRRHVVKGRTSFAFSDVRRLIAEAALDKDFLRLWPDPPKPAENGFASLLLRLVA